MMQAWADYLDSLRAGAEVVPIKRESELSKKPRLARRGENRVTLPGWRGSSQGEARRVRYANG